MEELSVTKSHLSESKATAAARLDTRRASSRRLQPDCKQVSPRNFIVQEEVLQGRRLAGEGLYYLQESKVAFTIHLRN